MLQIGYRYYCRKVRYKNSNSWEIVNNISTSASAWRSQRAADTVQVLARCVVVRPPPPRPIHNNLLISTDTPSTLMTTPLFPIVPYSLNWSMPSFHLRTLTSLTLTIILRVPQLLILSNLDSGSSSRSR